MPSRIRSCKFARSKLRLLVGVLTRPAGLTDCERRSEEVVTLPVKRPPSVRARQLATEIRRLREVRRLTGEEVAAQLGWSASKVSRIETGRSPVTVSDLRRLLDHYQVPGSRRDRLIELARTADQRGWWDAYADTLPRVHGDDRPRGCRRICAFLPPFPGARPAPDRGLHGRDRPVFARWSNLRRWCRSGSRCDLPVRPC